MPAQLEEIVINSHSVDPQHFRSRFPSASLPSVSRPPECVVDLRARRFGRWQRRHIELALRRSRQRVEQNEVDGTMCAGRVSFNKRRRSPTDRGAPDRAPHTRRAASRPATSSRTRTTASRTPAIPRSAASISPSSTRKPRSLICPSTRPTYSRSPSGKEPHPVPRPIEPPLAATKRIRDESLRRQIRTIPISTRHAHATDIELAHDSDRHRLQCLASRTYVCVFAIGRPIGTVRGSAPT